MLFKKVFGPERNFKSSQLVPSVLEIGNRGLNGLLADRFRVIIHLWVLLVKLNNFTFGLKAVLFSESTILDGRPNCRLASLEKLEI